MQIPSGRYTRGHSDNAAASSGGSPTFSTRRDSLRLPTDPKRRPTAPGADQGGRNPDPHQGRRQRRMGVRGVWVQAQQKMVTFRMTGRQRPRPQLARPGQPAWRHRLDRTARPFGGQGDQRRADRRAHQRSVLVGAADLGHQTRLPDHVGQPRGAPLSWSTTTERRASRAPGASAALTKTICPEAASTPQRSATAGGTDSAVKKESWLTPPTVGQDVHPRLDAVGAAFVSAG